MTNEEWIEAEKAKMKPSTMAFAERRCAENGKRIERERRGDNGQCIYITN